MGSVRRRNDSNPDITYISSDVSLRQIQNDSIHNQHQNASIMNECTPSIAYNCMLIPAAFIFWWYWTRRTARKVMKGLIGHVEQGEGLEVQDPDYPMGGETDHFETWEEVIKNEVQDDSVRFVRWIKGKRKYQRTRLKRATRRILRGNRPEARESISPDHSLFRNESSNSISSGGSFILPSESFSVMSVHWECIDDLPEVEVCATLGTNQTTYQHKKGRHFEANFTHKDDLQADYAALP